VADAMSGAGAAEVRLRVPASTQYLRVARMTLSATVGTAGFDIEEVEDLRIAIAELVSLLIDAGGPHVELVIHLLNGSVQVVGTTPAGVEPALDELTSQILTAIVDEYEVTTTDGVARFTFRKVAAAGSSSA